MNCTPRLLKIAALLLLAATHQANGQLFQQDFSLSNSTSYYVGAPPNSSQFDYIGTSGGGTVASINSGTLQFVRTGNAGYFARSTDFSPTPDNLKVEFYFSAPTASATTSSAAILRFGQSFTPNNSSTSNANTHTRLAFNLVSGGGFQIRDIATSSNSSTYSGSPLITMFINNSGASMDYNGPDGNVYSVDDDMIDVWVDFTLVFDDMAATTGSAVLTDMKMHFESGTGTIQFDNFNITTNTFLLPVELTHFSAAPDRTDVLLRWRTASEDENDYFQIQHSTDGQRFASIGKVAGHGTSDTPHDYAFRHTAPAPGTNYYRLRQVDFDGTEHFSPVRTVRFSDTNALQLFPNPASDQLHLRFEKAVREEATWAIVAADGKILRSGPFPAETTELEISVADLPEALYCLKINTSRQAWTSRFLKVMRG